MIFMTLVKLAGTAVRKVAMLRALLLVMVPGIVIVMVIAIVIVLVIIVVVNVVLTSRNSGTV